MLKTPVRTPQANAFYERVIGTMRREGLEWLIPCHERHLRGILRAWVYLLKSRLSALEALQTAGRDSDVV